MIEEELSQANLEAHTFLQSYKAFCLSLAPLLNTRLQPLQRFAILDLIDRGNQLKRLPQDHANPYKWLDDDSPTGLSQELRTYEASLEPWQRTKIQEIQKTLFENYLQEENNNDKEAS